MESVTQLVCVKPAEPILLDIRTAAMQRPRKGEVLVKVDAASINPIDAKRATGYGRRLLALKGAGRFPLVLGNDFAGEIVALGDDVTEWQPGSRVMGLVPTGKKGGAHTTHLTVDARLIRPAAPDRSAEQLASLPYSFTTLWLAFRAAGITEDNARGLKVLAYGASGGLGQLALQVLAHWGASVTAVCGTANLEACRVLGAAEVWDRTRTPIGDLPAHFDAGLNFGAWENEHALLGRLRQGALGHATTVHPLLGNVDRHGLLSGAWRARREFLNAQSLAAAKGARYGWVIFKPDEDALDALQRLLARTSLALPIAVAAPFADADRAFEHVVRQSAGRAVLLPHR